MCKGSKLSANIHFDSIKFIAGAQKLAADGVVPGGTKRNYDFIKEKVYWRLELKNLKEISQEMI
jgi:selenophosphate synthase